MGDEEGDMEMRGELDYDELAGISEDLNEEGPYIAQAQDHQQEVCADADDVKEEDRGDVAVKHRRGEEKVPGSEDVEEGEVTSDEEGEIKESDEDWRKQGGGRRASRYRSSLPPRRRSTRSEKDISSKKHHESVKKRGGRKDVGRGEGDRGKDRESLQEKRKDPRGCGDKEEEEQEKDSSSAGKLMTDGSKEDVDKEDKDADVEPKRRRGSHAAAGKDGATEEREEDSSDREATRRRKKSERKERQDSSSSGFSEGHSKDRRRHGRRSDSGSPTTSFSRSQSQSFSRSQSNSRSQSRSRSRSPRPRSYRYKDYHWNRTGHGRDSVEGEGGNKSPMPCRHYLSGKCSWGDNCRFLHEGTPKVDHHHRDRGGKMMGPGGFHGGGPMPPQGPPHMRGMFPPGGHGPEFGPPMMVPMRLRPRDVFGLPPDAPFPPHIMPPLPPQFASPGAKKRGNMSEVEEESDGWFRLRTITTEWNSEEEEEEKKARGETNVRIKSRRKLSVSDEEDTASHKSKEDYHAPKFPQAYPPPGYDWSKYWGADYHALERGKFGKTKRRRSENSSDEQSTSDLEDSAKAKGKKDKKAKKLKTSPDSDMSSLPERASASVSTPASKRPGDSSSDENGDDKHGKKAGKRTPRKMKKPMKDNDSEDDLASSRSGNDEDKAEGSKGKKSSSIDGEGMTKGAKTKKKGSADEEEVEGNLEGEGGKKKKKKKKKKSKQRGSSESSEDPLNPAMEEFQDFYPMHMGPPFPHPMHPPFPPHPLPPGAEPYPGGWLPHHQTPPPPHLHHHSPFPPQFPSRPPLGKIPPFSSPHHGSRRRDPPPQKDEFGRDISKRLEYNQNRSQKSDRSSPPSQESFESRRSPRSSPPRRTIHQQMPPVWRRDDRDLTERDRGEYRVQHHHRRHGGGDDRLRRKYQRRRHSSSNDNSRSATPSSRLTPSNTGSDEDDYGRSRDRRGYERRRSNRGRTYSSDTEDGDKPSHKSLTRKEKLLMELNKIDKVIEKKARRQN